MSEFEVGAEQLRRTHQQLEEITRALEAVKLDQFYALCEVVGRSPSLVDFYASALARITIVEEKIGTDISGQASVIDASLDKLREDNARERKELLTFFELFAPENPTYTEYLNPDKDDASTERLSIEQPDGAEALAITEPDNSSATEHIVTETATAEENEPRILSGREIVKLDSRKLALYLANQPNVSEKTTVVRVLDDLYMQVDDDVTRLRVPTDGSPSAVVLTLNASLMLLIEQAEEHVTLGKVLEMVGDEAISRSAVSQALRRFEIAGLLVRDDEVVGTENHYKLPAVIIFNDERLVNNPQPAVIANDDNVYEDSAAEESVAPVLTEKELHINGVRVQIDDLEKAILTRLEASSEPLSFEDISKDDYLLALLEEAVAAGVGRKPAEAFRKVLKRLENNYAEIVLTIGQARGTRYYLNPNYQVVSKEVISSLSLIERVPVLPGGVPQAKEAVAPTMPTPDGPPRQPRQSDSTKLFASGWRAGGQTFRFTDDEALLIDILATSPRKEALSPAAIIDIARGRGHRGLKAYEVDDLLENLASKLPDKWLTKEGNGSSSKPKGYRLGAGIRPKKPRR